MTLIPAAQGPGNQQSQEQIMPCSGHDLALFWTCSFRSVQELAAL